jgi:hypothetical protein
MKFGGTMNKIIFTFAYIIALTLGAFGIYLLVRFIMSLLKKNK